MEHVSTIVLGKDAAEQTANMKKILQLGFPRGIVATCFKCNDVQEFTLDQAAKHLTAGTWPRCCESKRMGMEDRDSIVPF